ncbi:hypothetical protein C1I98_06050 [Spongiactinospora gelatinilytica]|uniref:Peptidoglycan recognition protein family domain-containing protein n=1 Tax=Spongiactinospora gelatinilytica TaxID=2666298 RepID=A0A2W2HTA0_9ACTN|nr:peptidoglycan recognition family protein [Spongiactinospora gelatinilytica]PZG53118.1 hypothetical protein C1I98_06050 [Spongiactinospora gelatinilytica]
MKLVTRAALGWPPSAADHASPSRGLAIHYDGSDQGLARKPHSACLAYWRKTRAFHMGPSRGWSDLGYSWGACPHGYILEGRGLGRYQAAQGTTAGNRDWYSVTLMSGPNEDPTPEQIDAVRQLRAWLMSKGLGAAVRGHRDFFGTSCPGDRLYRLVKTGTFSRSPKEADDDVSAKDVWTYEIPVPFGTKENPEWQAKSLLLNSNERIRNLERQVGELTALVRELVERKS